MVSNTLAETAQAMVRPPGGILAADESKGTMGNRLAKIGITDDPEGPSTWRDAWREVMFGASLTPAVNAVILFEEQLRNPKLVRMLQDQGVIIGVKIDGGLAKFNGSDVEEITQGADAGLPDRLAQYYALGARFTKFRSFLHIDTERGFPSAACVEANAQVQARFARASQEAGLVPIVEPEIDMVGTHPLVVCQSVTERVLKLVFELLRKEGVSLGGLVLKPNMVLSGNKAENQASPEEVAAATLAVLKATVPVSVPGIAFLSGGQSDEEAYRNLNAIAQGPGGVRVPYELTYSFGRAAQDTARQVWQGKAENIEAARQAFETQLQRMSQARMGQLSH